MCMLDGNKIVYMLYVVHVVVVILLVYLSLSSWMWLWYSDQKACCDRDEALASQADFVFWLGSSLFQPCILLIPSTVIT